MKGQPITTICNTGIFIRKTRSFDLQDEGQLRKFIAEDAARWKRNPDAQSDIKTLEAQLATLLLMLGYPVKLPALSEKIATKNNDVPWAVRDAETALRELQELRVAMQHNDINNAVRHALRAQQFGMKAVVGVTEPLAQDGRGVRKGRALAGATTARIRRKQGEATLTKVLNMERTLRKNATGERAINKIIAINLGLTQQRVGQIRNQKEKKKRKNT